MGQIQKYKLCTDFADTEMRGIQNEVNELIKEGWQPLGAPSIIPGKSISIIVQAMILEDEQEMMFPEETFYQEPKWA